MSLNRCKSTFCFILFIEQFFFFFFWQFTDDLIDYVNVISVLCDLNLDRSDCYNRLQLNLKNKSQSISPKTIIGHSNLFLKKGEIRFHFKKLEILETLPTESNKSKVGNLVKIHYYVETCIVSGW